jgi:LacI family transcriptional regulator, galactose operon repressor
MIKKNITLKELAEQVGISKTAVSGVLNGNPNIRVSSKKVDKIFKIVKEHNYKANSFARALSTQRSYQIGFLLSSKVTLGLGNSFFSATLATVQAACQHRGYICLPSVYDLTAEVKDFIMPPKLQQRTVEGIIVAGEVRDEVLNLIRETGMPSYWLTKMANDSNDSLENIFCLPKSLDADGIKVILEYLSDNGHSKIGFAGASKNSNITDKLSNDIDNLKISNIPESSDDNFKYGYNLAQKWLALSSSKRYTALVANDQICLGFLFLLNQTNLSAPKDISIISSCDSPFCEWIFPGLTAGYNNHLGNAHLGTNLIMDILDKNISNSEAKKTLLNHSFKSDLIIRGSSGRAPI